MCQFHYESIRAWRNKPKAQWKTEQEKREAVSDQNPSTSNEAGPSKGKTSMVCVDDQTALHSPVLISRVKFMRFFINSGAEVNFSSVKDAVNHGFMYDMDGIKKISGFNGSSSIVDGLMDCETRLGTSGETRKVEFLVTPIVTITILGCSALTKLGFMMECKEMILLDDHGNVIRCSAVHTLKNLRSLAGHCWSSGAKRDLNTSFSDGKVKTRLEQSWSIVSTRGLSFFNSNHVGILAGKAFFLPQEAGKDCTCYLRFIWKVELL